MSGNVDLRRHQAESGFGRLGVGINLTADVVALVGLTLFLMDAVSYPRVVLNATAWVLLIAAVASSQLLQLGRVRLPRWSFTVLLVTGGAVVLLDIAGTWGTPPFQAYPLAAGTTGALLLTFVTRRPRRDMLIATGVLCIALVVAFGSSLDGDPIAFAPGVLLVVLAALPVVIGTSIAAIFRSVVRLQFDLTQVRSTTEAGTAVGMLASKELERLDLAAEHLLDDVATGRTTLPLDTQKAAEASALATQLRLHLIEDRRQTWLYHAVAESAVLDAAVTVTDPDGLAAHLGADQRDGLFSAIWLLVGERDVSSPLLSVTITRTDHSAPRVQRVRIAIEANGVPRRQVDASTWQAIGRVGLFTETAQGAMIRIDVDCALDAPSDR